MSGESFDPNSFDTASFDPNSFDIGSTPSPTPTPTPTPAPTPTPGPVLGVPIDTAARSVAINVKPI